MKNEKLRPFRPQPSLDRLGPAGRLLITAAAAFVMTMTALMATPIAALAQLPGTENGEWRYLG
ncbi:MAG TPA: hypothetical protein EYQ64_12205, partial [Gemmatimonadetes bacterium]|nr:hypothetical protein [Gemmatimonadota bacterium]